MNGADCPLWCTPGYHADPRHDGTTHVGESRVWTSPDRMRFSAAPLQVTYGVGDVREFVHLIYPQAESLLLPVDAVAGFAGAMDALGHDGLAALVRDVAAEMSAVGRHAAPPTTTETAP